jgi:hypothetical protein
MRSQRLWDASLPSYALDLIRNHSTKANNNFTQTQSAAKMNLVFS